MDLTLNMPADKVHKPFTGGSSLCKSVQGNKIQSVVSYLCPMSSEDRLLQTCLEAIEQQLGWGPASGWANQDFTDLSEQIFTVTSVQLSPTTLKRVWGRVTYHSSPSQSTLDALATFLGYDNYRAFRQAAEPAATTTPAPPARRKARNPMRLYLYYLLPLLGLAYLIYHFAPSPPPAPATAAKKDTTAAINPSDYRFSFRPVTTGVPNSVIFNYDASAAPYDSVFIQQNWDERRRSQVPQNQHTFTSIYYLPGFFNAKLLVGNQIVQQRDVYIRTDDWVAAVDRSPVPVYLPIEDVRQSGQLTIAKEQLKELDIDLEPPPITILTTVGQVEGLYTDDFTFRTRLRHNYTSGSAACQQTRILLLLKGSAIIIPLSRPGCVAELDLFAMGESISGRDNDLSAFGAIGDTFIEVSASGKHGLLTFSINGKAVYTIESKDINREFVGVRYEFSGTGSVDEISFRNGGGLVWEDRFD